jgi:protein-tyrosine kinase
MTAILGKEALQPDLKHPSGGSQRLGEILVREGKLHADDVPSVLRVQQEKGLRFGEAVVMLKLVSMQDVQSALSQQFRFSHIAPGTTSLSRELISAYVPFGTQAEAIRQLRTELLLRWFDGKRQALAINSAESGAGRSFLAANLAVSFSQLGEPTLLIDADLRAPRQHEIFGVNNQVGLSSLLSGRVDGDELVINQFQALPNLSLMPAGPRPPNPLELIGQNAFTRLLAAVTQRYSVVLLDTPAAALNADGRLVAARAGGSLLVVRKDKSRSEALAELIASFNASGTTIVGAEMNAY